MAPEPEARFDLEPAEPAIPTTPLDACLWVVFVVLLAVAPAVVWACYRVLL